jgi:2-keto-3-deoxy-L-rhamnonate aldolase RhmA
MTRVTDSLTFRERLRAREPLLGTFLKTPSPHATEILAEVGYDFVVVDAEHAPFDRVSTDLILLAARAGRIAALVRVPEPTAAHLLAALDDGAEGVLVPHVASVEAAQAIVRASHYRGGRRGFSNSPRAGRYGGLPTWPHVDKADARTTVLAMIEDPEAVENIDAIVSVEGLDGVFIGRGDLTVALEVESANAPEVRAATERVAAAAASRNVAVCAHVSAIDADEMRWLGSIGVTAFVVSSDQGYLRRAAAEVAAVFRDHQTQHP